VFDEFTDKFSKQVARLKVGSGFEPGVDVGPLISQEAVDKTRSFIADATEKALRLPSVAGLTGWAACFLSQL
jgi:succinate-semialdehyde dehydrogenase / glutarate-semialdehyde dehydrogenase